MYSSALTDAFLPVRYDTLNPWIRAVPILSEQRLLYPTLSNVASKLHARINANLS